MNEINSFNGKQDKRIIIYLILRSTHIHMIGAFVTIVSSKFSIKILPFNQQLIAAVHMIELENFP